MPIAAAGRLEAGIAGHGLPSRNDRDGEDIGAEGAEAPLDAMLPGLVEPIGRDIGGVVDGRARQSPPGFCSAVALPADRESR